MRMAVRVEEIKKGMYVMLPVSWYKHPFLKSEFTITKELQIRQILESGIKEVDIDTERSIIASGDIAAAHSDEPLKTMPAKSIIPDELREALSDAKLPHMEKAKAVQKHTTTLIANLLENPSAENIKEAKRGIAEVVDLVLSEDETAYYLLSITSHDYCTYTHCVSVLPVRLCNRKKWDLGAAMGGVGLLYLYPLRQCGFSLRFPGQGHIQEIDSPRHARTGCRFFPS